MALEKLWYFTILSQMSSTTFEAFTHTLAGNTQLMGLSERIEDYAVPELLRMGLINPMQNQRCTLTERGALFRTMERERVAEMYRRRIGMPQTTTAKDGIAIVSHFKDASVFRIKCDWYSGVTAVIYHDNGELSTVYTNLVAGMIDAETFHNIDTIMARSKEVVERVTAR